MSNVFDKRIFKSKDNYNNLINLKIYEANLKLFNINSLLGKVYPSLLSKCISFKNGNVLVGTQMENAAATTRNISKIAKQNAGSSVFAETIIGYHDGKNILFFSCGCV